jgi:hypothetical protein
MFYAGATFVTKAHSFRTYDWAGATGMVDRLLGGYALERTAPDTVPNPVSKLTDTGDVVVLHPRDARIAAG